MPISRRCGFDAIRADRAAIEFRGFPPAVRDELVGALGDKIAVQTSDWKLRQLRRAPTQKKAIRRCPRAPRPDLGDRPLAWRAAARQDRQCAHGRRHRLFPAPPLAADKEELQDIAGSRSTSRNRAPRQGVS